MFKGNKNLAVGLYVTVAITLLGSFSMWLAGKKGSEPMSRYSILLEQDVSGLSLGGVVYYLGVNIGNVVEMVLDSRGDDVRVRVDINILNSTPVDSDTYASLKPQGITGITIINLAAHEEGDHHPLERRDGFKYPLIPVRQTGLSALLSRAPEIMIKLDYLLEQANLLLGEENRAAIHGTLGNFETLTDSLAESRDTIAALPGDLNRTLSQVQNTLSQLQSVVAEAKPGLISTLDNLQQASDHLSGLAENLDQMISDHEDDMKRFIDDGLGETPALIAETRKALRELNKLVQELQDDPSLLIHRPEDDALRIDP
jgi:phospholipid/cholesterol/gamma-HCH transport system substrate-binding protein